MNDIFSILVIVGIFLTFTPQQLRIVRKKTSLGLSPHFMLLGVTSVIANLINIILLQYPSLDQCFKDNEKRNCMSDVLGIIQVGVLMVALGINCGLFLAYYPRPWSSIREGHEVQRCVYLFYAFCAFCALILAPTLIITGMHSNCTRYLGQFFGVFCFVLSCIQYVPQIVRTWVTKRIGALSATTLLIQFPGSFLFAYTLAFRPGADVTTWGSFFISGTFQAILVGMCVYLKKSGWDVEEEHRSLLIDSDV